MRPGYEPPVQRADRCSTYSKMLLAVEGFPLYEIFRSFSWRSESGGWTATRSSILVCPSCTRSWAHLKFEGEAYLYAEAAFCERCPRPADLWQSFPPAGSILTWHGYGCNIDSALVDVLPEPLLKREFLLHLNDETRRENGQS